MAKCLLIVCLLAGCGSNLQDAPTHSSSPSAKADHWGPQASSVLGNTFVMPAGTVDYLPHASCNCTPAYHGFPAIPWPPPPFQVAPKSCMKSTFAGSIQQFDFDCTYTNDKNEVIRNQGRALFDGDRYSLEVDTSGGKEPFFYSADVRFGERTAGTYFSKSGDYVFSALLDGISHDKNGCATSGRLTIMGDSPSEGSHYQQEVLGPNCGDVTVSR